MNAIFSRIMMVAALLGTAESGYAFEKHTREEIDYRPQFPDTVPEKAPAGTNHLAPMLDVGTLVPNGGIFRHFPAEGWKVGNVPRYTKVFSESPYQTTAPLRYERLDWFRYERGEGEYPFDEVVEPILKRCLSERARLILGMACNAGSKSVTQMQDGRALAVPLYLFKRLAASDHPMRRDDQFGPAWVPDYDSPILLSRHRALLRAFAAWIEGNVRGTSVKRKDMLFGIEMRYFGYWGEGAVRSEHYPKTVLFDEYIDTYTEAFPDILLIAGGQEALHLPKYQAYLKNPSNPFFITAMRHVGKLFRTRNKAGGVGFFIDSWHPYNHLYDIISERVLFDVQGRVVSLAETFRDEIYGSRYITGEFGYLTFLGDPSLAPYEGLYQQFTTRHVSGISLHNFTVKDGESLQTAKQKRGAYYLPGGLPIAESVYENARKCMSMLGYRIVLGTPKVSVKEKGREVSFTLANIGVSRVFCDYYQVHLLVEDAEGKILSDTALPFDLRTLPPAKKPLVWDEKTATPVIASVPGTEGSVFLQIIDKKGIELPLCLSNYGRRPDGSYQLADSARRQTIPQ